MTLDYFLQNYSTALIYLMGSIVFLVILNIIFNLTKVFRKWYDKL